MVLFFYTWVKKEIGALQPLVQECNTMTQPGLKLIPRQLTIFLNVLEVWVQHFSKFTSLRPPCAFNTEHFTNCNIYPCRHSLSWKDMVFLLWFSNAYCIIILIKVEGFYANKKKSRTKKYLLEWSQKAAQKATG